MVDGGIIQLETRRLLKLRARNKVIEVTNTENLTLHSIELSSNNVQKLRSLERPMEMTRELAGTTIGMQGTRYFWHETAGVDGGKLAVLPMANKRCERDVAPLGCPGAEKTSNVSKRMDRPVTSRWR